MRLARNVSAVVATAALIGFSQGGLADPAPSASPAAQLVSKYPLTAPKPLKLVTLTIQDHAVLQRDRAIPVWGQTSPRAKVSVTLGDKTLKTTADKVGKWQVKFAPLSAGGPYTLTAVSSDGVSQTISDLLIGDVFLCSGQSNMEMPVSVASNYNADIGGATNTNIRLFHVQRYPSAAPRDTFGADASWAVTSPTSVPDFSASCYNFGKNLQPVVKVPVGMIEDAWGGSIIQAWLSADRIRKLGGDDKVLSLLPLYANAPHAAEEKWTALAADWWRAHDPAVTAKPAWFDPAFDDSSWEPVVADGTWRFWNAPVLKDFNGTVWLRQSVTLSAEQAQGPAMLDLGAIDSSDIVWVNGHLIGAGQGYDILRHYAVPAGVLQPGRNVIVLSVLGGAGPLAKLGEMRLVPATGTAVALSAPWRFKTSATMEQTGSMPSIPWLNQFGTTVLANGMIHPLGATPIRAAVWYQGESNSDQPKPYADQLTGLIADWRGQFGADLPVLVVQLPNFGPYREGAGPSNWAEMREAQRTAVNATKNAGLVVTIDIGQMDNIHPTNKQEVGRRIALQTEKLVYGLDVVASGPTPVSAVRSGATVTVHLAHPGSALAIYGANRPTGFQLCDANRNCRYVDATRGGDDLALDASGFAEAAFVRYCWADSPFCNVYNAAGLPAVPFELPILAH